MKKLILTLAFTILSIAAHAQDGLVTYDLYNDHDEQVGELVLETKNARTIEHWVVYPDPTWAPNPEYYPDPSWYPNPEWKPSAVRGVAGSRNSFAFPSDLKMVQSDDGYTSVRQLVHGMVKGDRYFQKASVEIAPLPSP